VSEKKPVSAETYKNKVTEIANLIGWQLSEKTVPSGDAIFYRLIQGDMSFCIKCGGWSNVNRMYIIGSYPRRGDHQYTQSNLPAITCSAYRTAEAITNDIKRRFLGDYQEVYRKLWLNMMQDEQRDNGHQDLLERVSVASGKASRYWNSTATVHHTSRSGSRPIVEGNFYASIHDSVKQEVMITYDRLPIEVAEQLIYAANALMSAHKLSNA